MTNQITNEFPKIALGTWSWGTGAAGGDQVFGNHLTDSDLKPVVEAAMDSGFNLWDTAAVYGEGSSERILGTLLQPYNRNQYYLSTKFTPQMAGNGEHEMATMLAGSLKRLNTDYVDFYWIHNPADVEKWTPELISLVQSGKVKHVGVSNHNLAQIKRVNEILSVAGIKLDAVQNHYSLLYRSSEDAGILAYCQENDIQFFSYMVLEQGALSGRYNVANPLPAGSGRGETYNKVLPQLEKLTSAMRAIGDKQKVSIAEVATAWAVAKGTTPIIGVTKPKYIVSEQKSVAIKLTEADIIKLEALAKQTGVDTKGSWENSMI